MSRPSSAMQVATSTLNAPLQKSGSTAFCSFCSLAQASMAIASWLSHQELKGLGTEAPGVC